MAVKTEAVNFKDALLTIMYTQEALIKLLVRKGIITEEGLLEEIKKLRTKRYFLDAKTRVDPEHLSGGCRDTLGFLRFLTFAG